MPDPPPTVTEPTAEELARYFTKAAEKIELYGHLLSNEMSARRQAREMFTAVINALTRLTLAEEQRDEADRVLSLLVPGNFSEPRNQAVIRAGAERHRAKGKPHA
jgi:hypothetical protein